MVKWLALQSFLISLIMSTIPALLVWHVLSSSLLRYAFSYIFSTEDFNAALAKWTAQRKLLQRLVNIESPLNTTGYASTCYSCQCRELIAYP